MRFALDTNRYTDMRNDLPEALRRIGNANAVVIPFAVVVELNVDANVGFGQGRRKAANERALSRFMNLPGVAVAYPDRDTLNVFASLYLESKARLIAR